MNYTWGYIKENCLSKLNLDERSANEQGLLSRFPYYANEAMTQICSAVKPSHKYFTVRVVEKEIEDADTKDVDITVLKDVPLTMPDDFVAFSDDIVEHKPEPIFIGGIIVNRPTFEEVGDELFEYMGYNQIYFKECGIYRVPYKARWFFFTKELDNNEIITAPADVCDGLPSYIVSQCYKIDDETKSAVFRNEYEMFLARIDDSTFKSQRKFTIGGGW